MASLDYLLDLMRFHVGRCVSFRSFIFCFYLNFFFWRTSIKMWLSRFFFGVKLSSLSLSLLFLSKFILLYVFFWFLFYGAKKGQFQHDQIERLSKNKCEWAKWQSHTKRAMNVWRKKREKIIRVICMQFAHNARGLL